MFQLDVWKGDWGLPSVDLACLQVLAYSKFSGISLKINATCNPFMSVSGQLPVLRTNDRSLNSVKDIIQFLRNKYSNSDTILNPDQCSEIIAYEALLKDKLYPALQFIWWIDQRNLNELIRPWYCKAMPFPLNFYYPGKFEREAKKMFEILYPIDENITDVENKVYSEAQKCITLLSTKLGESEYFFGNQPTSLDAIVYSYLAPLLKAPLPNAALKHHLNACTNLVNFISRISQKYFEYEYREYETHKSKENVQTKPESDNDFPNKKRNQLIAGFCATLLMIGYALSTGIVQVTTQDDEDIIADYSVDDEDDEYE